MALQLGIFAAVCMLKTKKKKKGMEKDHGKWKRSLLIKPDTL